MTDLRLTRYEKYTDSNVEWLGEIPAHWTVTRNKDIFEERGSLSSTGDETLLTVSHITGVTRRSEKNVNMFMAETMEGYKHCSKDDLVINTMWAWMGALGTANEDGICSPAYGVYKPKKYLPYNRRYFDYLYRTPNVITEMTRNSKGIVSSRLRLYPKDFFQIKTALPPASEQVDIAAYIDKKVSHIDRKIDLLYEKITQYDHLKQSLINETITGGLDKSVEMKDSVPIHWNKTRFKGFVSFKKGKSPNKFSVNESDYPYLSMDYLRGREKKISYVQHNNECIFVGNDDLLVLWDGANAGDILKSKRGCLSSTIAIIKFKKSLLLKEYLYYFLKSKENEFKSFANGTTIPHFSPRVLTDQEFYIPEHKEQKLISEFLAQKVNNIDSSTQNIKKQIDKLMEFRTTLINDVVTGKIRVNDNEKIRG